MQDEEDDESTVQALKTEIDEAWKSVQESQGREVEMQGVIDKLKVSNSKCCFFTSFDANLTRRPKSKN